jgi:hypothetical protein
VRWITTKGESPKRRDKVVRPADGDHAAALHEKPTEGFIVGSMEVAGGTGELHDLANLGQSEIKCRLPKLLNELPRPLGAAGVGS